MKKRLTKCVAITAAISLAVGGWGAGGSAAAAEITAAESVSATGTASGSDSTAVDDGTAEETSQTDVQEQENTASADVITESGEDSYAGAEENSAAASGADAEISGSGSGAEETGTETGVDSEETQAVSDAGEEGQETQSAAGDSSGQAVQLLSTSVDQDINRPVIEDVELVQNGQTLHEGDSVEIRVYAYDADSGIREVLIRLIELNSEGDYWDIYAEYDETLGCYVASLTLDHVGNGQIRISYIHVVDQNSNYTDASVYDENNDPLYTFYLDTIIDVSVHMNGILPLF